MFEECTYYTIHLYRFVQITLPQNRKNLFRLEVEWLYQFGECIFTFYISSNRFFWLLVVLTSFSPCKIFESPPVRSVKRSERSSSKVALVQLVVVKKNTSKRPNPPGFGLAFQGLGSCLGNYLARFLSASWMSKNPKKTKDVTWRLLELVNPEQCVTGVWFFVVSEHDTWSHDLFPDSENMPFSTENGEREREMLPKGEAGWK